MKIKYSFKNHLVNRFYVYIGALIIVPLLCSYSILQKTSPKDFERFSVFIDTEYKDEGLFKDYLFTELKEDLVIDTYEMKRTDSLFNTYFSSYGLNSDICILSKTTLDRFETVYFLDLKETTFDKANNYQFKNYSIGVLCHQNGSDTLNEYIDFSVLDDDYYITVSKNSVHLKELTNSGKTNQISRILTKLTNYE